MASPNPNNKNKVSSSPLLLSYTASDQTNTTTFVQADPSTFRAVVQSLTGSTQLHPSTQKLPLTVPAARSAPKPNSAEMGPRRPGFKLHERRQSARKLEIQLNNRVGSARGSPKSPVSTLDLFARGSPKSPMEEEARAIAEKGFYLHPSPLHTPRGGGGGSEPELLHLFPLHSPRDINSSS